MQAHGFLSTKEMIYVRQPGVLHINYAV